MKSWILAPSPEPDSYSSPAFHVPPVCSPPSPKRSPPAFAPSALDLVLASQTSFCLHPEMLLRYPFVTSRHFWDIHGYLIMLIRDLHWPNKHYGLQIYASLGSIKESWNKNNIKWNKRYSRTDEVGSCVGLFCPQLWRRMFGLAQVYLVMYLWPIIHLSNTDCLPGIVRTWRPLMKS